jgi:hypothetical protein
MRVERVKAIRLDIEIWVIGKGITKRGIEKGMGGWGKRNRGYWVYVPCAV